MVKFSKKRRERREKGFIAITSVLIIGTLIVVLGVSVFHSSLTDQTISASYDAGQEASFLAEACVRAGIFKLKNNVNYPGFSLDVRENIDECAEGRTCVNGIPCDVRINNINQNTKIVSSFSRAGDRPHFKTASTRLRYVISDWARDFSCTGITTEGDNLILQNVGAFSENIIPQMSSNLSNGHIASSLYQKNDPFRVFNRSTLDGYNSLAGQIPNWIQIQFPTNKTVGRYVIVSLSGENFNAQHTPRSWRLEGSNNGIDWSVLDSVNEEINWVNGERKEFIPDIIGSYSFYRVNFIGVNNADGILTVGEIEMYEPVTTFIREGECLSYGYNILGDIDILNSQIFWKEIIPAGTSITIETRLKMAGLTGNWTPVLNGRGIPGINDNKWETLDIRIRFQSTNETLSPRLSRLSTFIKAKD